MRNTFLLLLCIFVQLIVGGQHQRRLLKYLLTRKQYNPLERPVANDTQTLPVTINMALQQIIDYDGKNEIIALSGWLVLKWKDYSLTWNPEEFGDIRTLRLPSTQLWIPDVLLYSSADENSDSTIKVNAVVQNTGDILYVPPGIFKSVCSFDIAAFPFVSVNFTAETSHGQLDAYIKNAEWDLQDFTATSHRLQYDCCPDWYPYVLFTIRIRRRSLHYVTNIIVPCFLISCLTIIGFLLAPDSGEKLTLQITILLSAIMFSLVISDILPPKSNGIPIISKYFLCVMIMSTLSVLASILVISLNHRNAKFYQMPPWIEKYICTYLAALLGVSRADRDLSWKGIRRQWFPPTKSNGMKVEGQPKISLDNDFETGQCEVKAKDTDSPSKIHRIESNDSFELRTAISQLLATARELRETSKYEEGSKDWKFVAIVLDRFFLIVFTFFMIAFTAFTYLSIPTSSTTLASAQSI